MRHKNIHFVLHKQTDMKPFGLMVEKNESSISTCLLCVTHEDAQSICASVCKSLLQLLLGPLRSLTFPGQLRLTAQSGYYRSRLSSTSFLFSFSLCSLSSTFFVSLCFTLCLHITLWVVSS